LEKALYGHKNSGAYWQEFCNRQCLLAGFKPISDNWPCAYWNEEKHQLLIVYVDDMKLSGPLQYMKLTWDLLGENITLEAPKGNSDNAMTFLGCENRLVESMFEHPEGKVKLRGMTWDVSHSMRRCVAKYEAVVFSITGRYPRIVHTDTPVKPSETKHAECRAPNNGERFYECPICLDIFSESLMNNKFLVERNAQSEIFSP